MKVLSAENKHKWKIRQRWGIGAEGNHKRTQMIDS